VKILAEDWAVGPGKRFTEDDIDEIKMMDQLAESIKMYEEEDSVDIKTQTEVMEDKDEVIAEEKK